MLTNFMSLVCVKIFIIWVLSIPLLLSRDVLPLSKIAFLLDTGPADRKIPHLCFFIFKVFFFFSQCIDEDLSSVNVLREIRTCCFGTIIALISFLIPFFLPKFFSF
ncbi:hypothetical protein Dimus_031273 [Dionaea muscipula]